MAGGKFRNCLAVGRRSKNGCEKVTVAMDEMFLEDEESGLLVSNLGRVVGPTGIVQKGYPNGRGYLMASYHVDGRHVFVSTHRLVARNFLPNPKGYLEVNHKDENKKNNRVDNLEWCSRRYNMNYGSTMRRMMETRKRKGCTCFVEKPIKLVKGDCVLECKSRTEAASLIGTAHQGVDNLANGKLLSIKGWHLEGVTPPTIRRGPVQLERKGVVREFKSASEAARELNINSSYVNQVVSGKRKTCHGWHQVGVCVVPQNKPIKLRKGRVVLSFVSSTKACRYIGTHILKMKRLREGEISSINGWHLAK